MLKKKAFYLFEILIIIVFFACINTNITKNPQTDKVGSITETIPKDNKNEEYKVKEPSIIKTDTKTDSVSNKTINQNMPCWINNAEPEKCIALKNMSNNWKFFVDKIITNKIEKINDKHKTEIQVKLVSQYIGAIKTYIQGEIKYFQVCLSDETSEQCNNILNEKIKLVSQGTINPNEVEVIEYYIENTNQPEKSVIWGLGRVERIKYEKKLEKILPDDEYVPKVGKVQILHTLDNTNSKYIFEPEELENCSDVETYFNKYITTESKDNLLQKILENVKKKYKQRKEGRYLNKSVMETNSECHKKYNRNCSEDEYLIIESKMQQEYNRIASCWQKMATKRDTDYIEKIKQSSEKSKIYHHYERKFEHLINQWSYQIESQMYNKQRINRLEQIYLSKKLLLNHMYLIFIIVQEDFRDESIRVIEQYSDKLAQHAIIKQGTKYEILKNIILHNGNNYESIKANYKVNISPVTFDRLRIQPRNLSAQIMKYKVTFSSNTAKDCFKENYSILENIKAKTFIIAGNEDISISKESIIKDDIKPELPNMNKIDKDKPLLVLKCNNKSELQNNAYKRWKDIITDINLRNKNKYNIQKLINEVIEDNIKTKKSSISYKIQNDYEKEVILKEIEQSKHEIININKELYNIINVHNILPPTLDNNNQKEEIAEKIKQDWLENLKEKARNEEKNREELNRTQPKVVQVLIDDIFREVNLIDDISVKIKKQFYESYKDLCSSVIIGNIEIVNDKTETNENLAGNIHPILLGYQTPVFMIKPQIDSNSAKCSLPIMLDIRCESIVKSFEYNEKIKEILDQTTNIRWKIQDKIVPMRRLNIDSEWEVPNFNDDFSMNEYYRDYKKFCKSYSNYYAKSNFLYQNFPKIKCLQRFEIEGDLIIDTLRREEWKIFNETNFYNLKRIEEHSSWMLNTDESLERFFKELLLCLERGDVDTKIINMLGNKFYLSSTNVATRSFSALQFDFTNKTIKQDRVASDSILSSILTRKLR